jgi:FtsZ-interacting cell division protein ZipA
VNNQESIKMNNNKKFNILPIIIIVIIIIVLIIIFILLLSDKNKKTEKELKSNTSSTIKPEDKKNSDSEKINKPQPNDTKKNASQKPKPSQNKPSQNKNLSKSLKSKKENIHFSKFDKVLWEEAVLQTKKIIRNRKNAQFPTLETKGTMIKKLSKDTFLVSGFFIMNKTKKYTFQCKVGFNDRKQLATNIPTIKQSE